MRRTFNDLARAAEVKDLVTRSVSGHLTERMQEHYPTVSGSEQRQSIGKVVDLMTPSRPTESEPVAEIRFRRSTTWYLQHPPETGTTEAPGGAPPKKPTESTLSTG